ncbi:hypothetical protein EAG14_08220 [Acidovorax sp. 1608163]|uniref:hypothetical protein n=1 Tax=Acidovorax sp. 1608163 TaxID=2478662 RepID=UPI000EF6647B|nr:hypothetical protein [Acidovorax sp. 1608163]AYM96071.1 hypothetical protein EAG14_08220 [Acidovorax sp. 1608163]
MAGSNVFEVRASVPIAEVIQALSLLIATAQASAHAIASHAERVNETPGAAWAPVCLLELAEDLHAAIQAGCIDKRAIG